MAITLLSTREIPESAKLRMRFSISGSHKRGLATEALQGMAKENDIKVGADKAYDELVKRFGREAVEQRMATYIVLRASLPEIRKQDIRILFNPEPVNATMPGVLDATDAEFDVDVFVHPHFELSSYEPVYLHEPPAQVTKEMINAQLMREMNRFATYEETDGPVAEGDVVQVNMSTLANGVPEVSLSGDELAIVLSSDLMPKGFVDNVVGMNKGQHKEFQFTNMEGNQNLVHYSVAIDVLDKRRRIVPELTDEFVASRLSETDKTVAEFRERVRHHLEGQVGEGDFTRREELADTELGRRLRGTIPDALIERTAADMMESIKANSAAQGLTLSQFMQLQGMDEKQFQMTVMMQARESLRQGLALDALFDHLGLTLEDGDLDRALTELAPGQEDEARRNFQVNDAWFIVRNMAVRLKAHDWLMKTAVFA